MNIINQVEQAQVGKQIELSTQELIALKDKWEEIQNVFTEYGDSRIGEKRMKYNGREAMEHLTPLCEQMHNFMNQITERVQSTSEVHDRLFTPEIDLSLEA